jgi:hypothetical protein
LALDIRGMECSTKKIWAKEILHIVEITL